MRNLNAQSLKGRDIYLDFSRDRDRRPGPPRGGQDGGHHSMHAPEVHAPGGGAGNSGGYGAPPQMHHGNQQGGYPVPTAPPMQQYPGLVSAPPQGGQPQVGPGQLVFQGNVPSFPGQGQMMQPIILSADGKVLSGQAPPGGLLLQGPGAGPMGVPGVGAAAAMPGAPPAPQPALLPPQVMSGGAGGALPPSAPPPPQQPRGVDGGGMGGMQHAQASPAAVAAAVPKEPSELKPDLPVGIATAQHVRPGAVCLPFARLGASASTSR